MILSDAHRHRQTPTIRETRIEEEEKHGDNLLYIYWFDKSCYSFLLHLLMCRRTALIDLKKEQDEEFLYLIRLICIDNIFYGCDKLR